MTETDICNIALGKIGGAGDALNGNAFISNIDESNKVASWCKLNFPRARRRTIKKLASLDSPFRSTIRFRDLGTALSDDSVPEIGQWECAFDLPGDCLHVVRQFEEAAISVRTRSRPYQTRANAFQSTLEVRSQVNFQFEIIANKDGNGKILLTNVLTNLDKDSAFIEYIADTPNTGSFSEEMIECIATLLAHGVAPVVGRDMETAAFLLQQYREIAVPDAQSANQRGFNDTARSIPDYSGGRSTTLPHRYTNIGVPT